MAVSAPDARRRLVMMSENALTSPVRRFVSELTLTPMCVSWINERAVAVEEPPLARDWRRQRPTKAMRHKGLARPLERSTVSTASRNQ